MKLFNAFNHTFAEGFIPIDELWEALRNIPSLNGVYICHPEYIETAGISATKTSPRKVVAWYNFLGDGNYLFSTKRFTGTNPYLNAPDLILNDSQFNGYPSIDFKDDGSTRLNFHRSIEVGTVVIVYLTRNPTGYLIYSPRVLDGNPKTYYDVFPPGNNGTLWGNESFAQGSVFQADSRVNGRNVLPSYIVPLNSTRILTVKDISGSSRIETITGFGGRIGSLGGSEFPSNQTDSVKGKIAAIITFSEDISVQEVSNVEVALSQIYIDYSGVVITSIPIFKRIINTFFTYDFSQIALDEWFDITSYEILHPLNLGLTFTGSILSGALTELYDGKLRIRITNSNNMSNDFEFEFEVCKRDPVIPLLPYPNDISLVLSSSRDYLDNATYGLKQQNNRITVWEDARRVVANNPSPVLSVLDTEQNLRPLYIDSSPQINNQPVADFTNPLHKLAGINNTSFLAKTFLWFYVQKTYGVRKLLDSLSDIKGTGELWTISNLNQLHGTTSLTRQQATVQKVPVNTLSYQLPLETPVFITATHPDADIPFTGFESLRGHLGFFCAWNRRLTNAELSDAIALLAARYYSDLSPYLFNDETEQRNQANITVDLKTKIVDLQNLTLSYTLVDSHYNATISSDGILSFIASRDEVLTFSIDVTNTINLTTRLTFDIDIVLKTNALYLNLKTFITNFNAFFIAELDSIESSGINLLTWKDYRENLLEATGIDTTLDSLYQLDNKRTVVFNINGSSYLDLNGSVSGRTFVLAYIRDELATNRAFLFGQDNDLDFLAGSNGQLFDSSADSAIRNGTMVINGRQNSFNYIPQKNILNTIVFTTTNSLMVDSIAKDRIFNDRSVKGYIPFIAILPTVLTFEECVKVSTFIRDYYDSEKSILHLHCDNVLQDVSDRNKIVVTNSSLASNVRRFGSGSLALVNNSQVSFIRITNDTDFAFLNEDFSISFWININRNLNVGDILSLYNQTDLVIYLHEQTLKVGRNLLPDLAIVSHILPNNFYNNQGVFNHIELNKVEDRLYLFINGIAVTNIANDFEYRDYNSDVFIGQTTNIATAGVNVYLDEIYVYRRKGFNTSNFTPPSTPYT